LPLIEIAIGQSMVICAGDFAEEIAATIEFVNENFEASRISY
jgi:hypothetical protein